MNALVKMQGCSIRGYPKQQPQNQGTLVIDTASVTDVSRFRAPRALAAKSVTTISEVAW
jgi:hypothetical protein